MGCCAAAGAETAQARIRAARAAESFMLLPPVICGKLRTIRRRASAGCSGHDTFRHEHIDLVFGVARLTQHLARVLAQERSGTVDAGWRLREVQRAAEGLDRTRLRMLQ